MGGTGPIAILIAVVSIAGLAFWFVYLNERSFEAFLPAMSLPVLIPGGVLFTLLNAAYEELLFRGIAFNLFRRAVGLTAALLLQSFWFGLFHFASGFPGGYIGTALTFLFGLGVGYLVYRTGGILIAVAVHAAADCSIFGLVLHRSYGLI